MKATRGAVHQDWKFDGKTITVHIPMAWKRHGGRKVIISPDGSDAWAPAKPRQDAVLIRSLARAHRWKRMLEEGRYRSAAEIAEAEGVTRSFINRLLRLALLAPDIQEAILDGPQPKALRLNDLVLLPDDWGEQRERLIRASAAPRRCGDRQADLRFASPGIARLQRPDAARS
jgi:hypothetical protein